MEPWPAGWLEAGFLKNVVLLELFPIVLSVELWAEAFWNKKVHCNCDNMGVVSAINSISASSLPVVQSLRYLVLSCLRMNTCIYVVYIPGATNKLADALSLFQWDNFRALAPEVERLGVPCPQQLWTIALDSPLD